MAKIVIELKNPKTKVEIDKGTWSIPQKITIEDSFVIVEKDSSDPDNIKYQIEVNNRKKCKRCGEYKLRKDYYKNPGSSTGVQSYCKECINRAKREREQRFSDRYVIRRKSLNEF